MSVRKSIPEPATRLIHLLAAAGLCVAQPLYSVLGRHAEFTIAHRLEGGDLWLVAGVLSFGLAAALWCVSLLGGLAAARVGEGLHSICLSALLGLGALGLLETWPQGLATRLLLWACVSFAIAAAYGRSPLLRRLLSWLAVGAVLFPSLFLWRVLPRAADDAPAVDALLDGPPIVLIVFDELPMASLLETSDGLDSARFPNFAQLAATATWFSEATAVAQTTRAAVPAIVTGRYPSGDLPPTAEGHPESLFARARGRYNLNVVETTTDLCGEACDGDVELLAWSERVPPALADLVAVYLALVMPGVGPAVDEDWADYWVPDAPAVFAPAEGLQGHWKPWEPPRRFARFVRRLEASPRTTLHYLHLALPHVPWRFLPSGQAYAREQGRAHGIGPGGVWSGSEWEVLQGHQRHLVQLQYADTLLGHVMAVLRERELFDEALIVVVADHGAAFRRGERRRALTETNLVDIAHVPLFVKWPGQTTGESRDGNVETIDIAPTIATRMGLDLPGPVDGVPLSSREVRDGTKSIFRNWEEVGAGERWDFETKRLEKTAISVEAKNDRFPEASLYRIGPDRALVGREVATLEQVPARAKIVLEHAAAFDAVDPGAWMLPVHVMGRVEVKEPVSSPLRLALALDGVIQGVTRTFGELPATEVRFSALLDPAALRRGRQRLEIFVIEEAGTLSPAIRR